MEGENVCTLLISSSRDAPGTDPSPRFIHYICTNWIFRQLFCKKRKKPIKHEQKVLFALKAVPIRIQLFARSPPFLGDIRKRRQKWQITSIKAKQIHSPLPHTHTQSEARTKSPMFKKVNCIPAEGNKQKKCQRNGKVLLFFLSYTVCLCAWRQPN